MNNTVFNIDTLDDDVSENFDKNKPWIFETDDEQIAFATEDEACAAQREFRIAHGLNPITGEKQ